jgi:polyisoprenoid-binding protein YceI
MTRNRWIVIAVAALVVAVAGGFVAYDQVLRGDSVPPLSFGTPAPSDDASSADGSSSGAASAGPAGSSDLTSGQQGTQLTAADLNGDWKVADGSIVGYRVREKLASLPAQSDAVGRTDVVTGQATITASGDTAQVTAASFEADVTTLKSDRDMRDRRIHVMGLESDTYPTASFDLGDPIHVPAAALSGQPVDVTLKGDFQIHGVRKAVEIPAQAVHTDKGIEVLGSLTFPFSDFGMTPPSIGGFVNVENDATLEFLIVLAKG